MTSFTSHPSSTWQLQELDDIGRRNRLNRLLAYPRLLTQIASRSEVLRSTVVPAQDEPRALRLEALLRVDSRDLDLFFNSRSGYRAQYYESEELGKAANGFAVETFLLSLVERAVHHQTQEAAGRIARQSLEAESAKFWIYQCTWLRRCRRVDRVLCVPRWQGCVTSEDRRVRKLVRWGSLAPGTESRVVVKGAFIKDGLPIKLGKALEIRSSEIHNFGFT